MKVRNWVGAETPIIKINSEMNANAFTINYLEGRWASIIKSILKRKENDANARIQKNQ